MQTTTSKWNSSYARSHSMARRTRSTLRSQDEVDGDRRCDRCCSWRGCRRRYGQVRWLRSERRTHLAQAESGDGGTAVGLIQSVLEIERRALSSAPSFYLSNYSLGAVVPCDSAPVVNPDSGSHHTDDERRRSSDRGAECPTSVPTDCRADEGEDLSHKKRTIRLLRLVRRIAAAPGSRKY